MYIHTIQGLKKQFFQFSCIIFSTNFPFLFLLFYCNFYLSHIHFLSKQLPFSSKSGFIFQSTQLPSFYTDIINFYHSLFLFTNFIHLSFLVSSLAINTSFHATSFLSNAPLILPFFLPILTKPHIYLALSTSACFTSPHISLTSLTSLYSTMLLSRTPPYSSLCCAIVRSYSHYWFPIPFISFLLVLHVPTKNI